MGWGGVVSFWFSVVSCWLSVVGCWLSVVGCWLLDDPTGISPVGSGGIVVLVDGYVFHFFITYSLNLYSLLPSRFNLWIIRSHSFF